MRRSIRHRSLRLPFDPLLTLAVIGLGIASLLTLKSATADVIAGDPHYYVVRQGIYLGVGFTLMLALSRLDYARLRRSKSGSTRC